VTSRYYGPTENLLPEYAWCLADGKDRTWPVGRLKPNDLGLFDMLGNAVEWCTDRYVEEYPMDHEEDTPPTQTVDDEHNGVLRGGAFNPLFANVRAAYRYNILPKSPNHYVGFRPARSYH
jgi:formylglycine-generating enzyme required for sulfatase activity